MSYRVLYTTIFIILVSTLTSCGYFNSGTWENDSKNWNRIFGTDKPKDVNVKNSWYWKSAHWSYEYEYYLEIESCETIKKDILSNPNLKLIEVKDVSTVNSLLTNESKPIWFIPKPLEQYQIWSSSDEMIEFKFLIDKETGNMFLYDQQL